MSGSSTAEFTGRTWTIRQLFNDRRFVLDTYQRDYRWEETHLADLINDLVGQFRKNWSPHHETQDVATYKPYFLGSIVTYKRDRTVLVDGQQRLTTLMLLLMWLDRLQGDRADAVEGLRSLVISQHFGKRTFAVEDPVDERRPVLERLLAGESVVITPATKPSIRNMAERYENIGALFPDDLKDDLLPFFLYWLLGRVTLVEISTYSDESALDTFETMNDRGLRLTPLDLIKSYILSEAPPAGRAQIDQIWRGRLSELAAADNNGPTSFVRNWLRAKYSRDAADDDAIGGAPHKWLRENARALGLEYAPQFLGLITQNFDALARRYLKVLEASKAPEDDLAPVYYNSLNNVVLQFPLILAAIRPDDDGSMVERKIRLVAGFLDIYVARGMINSKDYRTESLAKGMYALAREIRDQDADFIAKRLGDEVAAITDTFDGVEALALRSGNRTRIKYLLARMTAWLQCHGAADGPKIEAEAVRAYRQLEIEHIWADRSDYQPEIPLRRFPSVRNRFGALVLLPKSINQALGAYRFEKKLDHYFGENLLVRSLHKNCYKANPPFVKLMDETGLPFRGYEGEFNEAAIGERTKLYRRLCELVWAPHQYGLIVPATRVEESKVRAKVHFGVTLRRLQERGFIPAGAELIGIHMEQEHAARMTADGRIKIETGEIYDTPSAAAVAVLEKPSWNGWLFWRVRMSDGSTPTIDAVRKEALRSGLQDDGES